MSKAMQSQVLPILFLVGILPVAQIGHTSDATTYTTTPIAPTSGDASIATLTSYLYNLGGELGFDLKTAATSPISTLLVNPPAILQAIASTTLITMMGAIPVDVSSLNPAAVNFVPSNNATYTAFNTLANNTFTSYNSPAGATSTSASATVSPLMDQQTYQSDPVSQYILNLMSTPNHSYCMDPTGTVWLNNNSQTIGDCAYLYNNKILNNVVGTVPPTPFVIPTAQNPALSDLNSNVLLSPLLYSSTPSSSTPASQGNTGLTSHSQIQQANNFIRYATGSVLPLASPSQVNYNNLLIAVNSTANGREMQESALAMLDTYIAGMRVYAAKTSVPVSNLYYILSKRIPQVPSGTTGNGTSQALTEMAMATRRMYDPAALAAGKPQWLTQIDSASPATVQKEMAILLAEINYQLYLNRQQDERLLLTNSLMLLESLKQDMPEVPTAESIASVTTPPALGTTTPTPSTGGSDTGEE